MSGHAEGLLGARHQAQPHYGYHNGSHEWVLELNHLNLNPGLPLGKLHDLSVPQFPHL